MKAPWFWYKPAGLMTVLLEPLEIFYLLSLVRRLLIKPYHASVPVICVGNVVAGGSGKTPTAIALATLLIKKGARPVFVTRGYRGKEKGPLKVDVARHTAEDIGDEALLLADVAPTWVGRDRAAAIRLAENEATHIILDDGLQNPHIEPSMSFLVMDAQSGIGNGHLIPSGPLREPLDLALRRVKAVMAIGGELPSPVRRKIEARQLRIFTGEIKPRMPNDFLSTKNYFAFAGIGRPQKFYATCEKAGLRIVGTRDFGDHHVLSERDCNELRERALKMNAQLLTTEKDAARLPKLMKAEVQVLPIDLVFDDSEALASLLLSETLP